MMSDSGRIHFRFLPRKLADFPDVNVTAPVGGIQLVKGVDLLQKVSSAQSVSAMPISAVPGTIPAHAPSDQKQRSGSL